MKTLKRSRGRDEPWPRPGDRRRIDGTRYLLTHISFSDDDWGSRLGLEYVEEKPYLAAQMVPRAPWWRRALDWPRRALRTGRNSEAAPDR